MLPIRPRPLPLPANTQPCLDALELRGTTYQDRRMVLAAVQDALLTCGCWVLERKAETFTQTHFCFEVQLQGVLELYVALVAAGLELAPMSHLELTAACMLRKHNPEPAELGRVLRFRLEINFLEDAELMVITAPDMASA